MGTVTQQTILQEKIAKETIGINEHEEIMNQEMEKIEAESAIQVERRMKEMKKAQSVKQEEVLELKDEIEEGLKDRASLKERIEKLSK